MGKVIWQSSDEFSIFSAGTSSNAKGTIKSIDSYDPSLCKIETSAAQSSGGYC